MELYHDKNLEIKGKKKVWLAQKLLYKMDNKSDFPDMFMFSCSFNVIKQECEQADVDAAFNVTSFKPQL